MTTTRLIVHKFDPLTPAPGGIDTCIRGLLTYAADDFVVVGVAGRDAERRVGKIEEHSFGDRVMRFLPVAKLDPGNQIRRVPHAARIAAGVARYHRAVPRADVLQTHRADLGYLLARTPRMPRSHHYFIHTQESGNLGNHADSFWRRAAGVHRAMERRVVDHADAVTVFNPDYAELVKTWNPNTIASPTWWDPAVIRSGGERDADLLLWVGRFETPKRPHLAVEVLQRLRELDPERSWRLMMAGGGNLLDDVRQQVAEKGLDGVVTTAGRLPPEGIAEAMSRASVLLMTSVGGYEGYPRVLVEGLASGVPVVATRGTDTGGLLNGSNGIACEEDPVGLARAVLEATTFDRTVVRDSVAELSAPVLVERIYRARQQPSRADVEAGR